MKQNEFLQFAENSIISKARLHSYILHDSVNQKYDDKPYSAHLDMVYEYSVKYIENILTSDIEPKYILYVLASAFTHDLIEDARQTYNDLVKLFGLEIAEITYAVTDEKGKTRKQRKNAKFYRELKKVPCADYIKICDRLANVKYSTNINSGMSKTYKKEYEHFKKMLYKDQYKNMFDELDELIYKKG